MATKGVELASAYISLSVSTDKVPGEIKRALNGSTRDAQQAGTRMGTAYSNAVGVAAASGMTGHGKTAASKFTDGFQSDAERRGARVGTAVGTVIGRGMGLAISASLTAATAGLGAIVGGIGITLFKGFDRYRSLDATAKRLEAMGKTGEQVKGIIGDINKVVEGTPIALDAAAGAATQFLQGGVKEGKELQDALTAIADAAGASGGNFEELAIIFGQVMNKGKLQAEEMMQFNERGINIQAALREEYKLSADELDKMSKDGSISFDMLVKSIEGKFSGMSKKMADTIDGAIIQLQTSVGRVGANFIAAIFGDPLDTTEGPGAMAQSINNITNKINDLNTWVVGHQGEIKAFFEDAAGVARGLAEGVKDVGVFLKEHPGLIQAVVIGFGAWKALTIGAGAISAVSTALTGISTLLGKTIPASAATGSGAIATFSATSMARLGPLAALLGGIGYSIAFGDRDVNPQTQTSGGAGQPQLPGLGTSGQSPPSNGNPTPGLFNPSSDPANANTGGSIFGGPGAQAARRGGPGFFGTAAGGSPREFAHQTMMPYWQKQGFEVGDHEADQYGEHQNGALDIMIPNLEAGQRILQQVLQDPNVYGVIFNGQSYGYGRGMTPKPYSGPNPHTDHVHVWYKPQGMATGGGVSGAGGPRSDAIPAYLSNGEHVLTAAEVAMMGGQSGVYAFRNALHRNGGGQITDRGGPGPDLLLEVLRGGWWDPKYTEQMRRGPALHRNTGGEVDWLPGDRKRTPGWVPRGNFNPNMKIDTSMASSSGTPWFYKMLTEAGGVAPWMTERVGQPWHYGAWINMVTGKAGHDESLSKKLPTWPLIDWSKAPRNPRKPPRLGFAEGGAISLDILKRLQESGQLPQGPVPPGAMQGLQAGAQAFNAKQQGFGSEITQAGRTEGYIPAGAGFTGKTGGGLAGGLLQMGAEAVKGAIDMAASAGAGMFPGAGAAVGMGAQAAKRGVDYLAEMGGIGIGAFSEIFMPFGAPRWLSDVDPTSFMPQMGVQPAAVTSGEQAMQNEVAQQQHGLTPGQPPGPMAPPPPAVQAGADAFRQAQAAHPLGTMAGQQFQPQQDPFNLLNLFGFRNGGAVFDNGGILEPNMTGINLSNRPEYVFTQSQLKAMEANASNGAAGSGSGPTYNIYPRDVDEAVRELRRKERLAMLQHAGRP